jgi:CheY-like chemotaxis protein
MKILLVEDTGSAAYPLTEYLEQRGHEVLLVNNVVGAGSKLKSEKPDCLVVDLNMEPRGLEPAEIKKTQGGLFTGWVWLKNHVFPENEDMRKRTIVLTAYEKKFKENIPSGERAGVKVVSKNPGQGNIYEEILNFVNAIGEGLKNRVREK